MKMNKRLNWIINYTDSHKDELGGSFNPFVLTPTKDTSINKTSNNTQLTTKINNLDSSDGTSQNTQFSDKLKKSWSKQLLLWLSNWFNKLATRQ